jgi:hypothetical protein
VIITRGNDRRLALSATDFVANGDRWNVASVRPDGALDVRHSRSQRRVTLPADYVAEQVQLGYATTVHGAQGQTVDTSHTVLTGTESRQLLYVALTRGRHENYLYLDVTVPGEDAAMTIEAQRPSTAVELLTQGDRARQLGRLGHHDPSSGARPRPAAAQGVCRACRRAHRRRRIHPRHIGHGSHFRAGGGGRPRHQRLAGVARPARPVAAGRAQR